MQFHLSIFGICSGLLLSAVHVANAYMVDTFENDDCTGEVQSVNVWDNTCATWPHGFQSFRLTWPGGNYQRLYTFSRDSCSTWFSGVTATGMFVREDENYPGRLEYQEVYNIGTGELMYVRAPCVKATNRDGGSNALASWHN